MLPLHGPPAPKAWFPFPPSRLNLTDRVKEPLEQLRFLAEQYKTTSGLDELLDKPLVEPLVEPLDLTPRRETNSSPASSFTPLPTSNKNPKFLNKPSPLYTPHPPRVVRNDGCETQDGEAGLVDTPYSYPVKARDAYVDVKATTASGSPTIYDSAATLRTEEGAATQKPSSPKTDRPREEREGSPEVREISVSHMLPCMPRENGGKMEIEVPLSVFHNWLRLYGSSAMMHGAKQLPVIPRQEEQGNCPDKDIHPTNLSFHTNLQQRSSAPEDLRLTQRNLPSPIPTTQTASNHHNTSQNHFTTYKPLPSGGILKNAASRDVYPFDQQYFNKSYSSKCWDAFNKETQVPPIKVNVDSCPRTILPAYNEDTVQAGKEKSGMGPSANPLLHLTTEEVMKLKKMISNSW